MRKLLFILGIALLYVIPTAAADAQQPVQDYVLLGKADKLPENLEQLVAAEGGAVAYVVPEIGLAVLTSTNPNFQAQMESHFDVESVSPDIQVNYDVPEITPELLPTPSGSPFDFSQFQWNLDAIDAPEAWATGARGAGVRIAIVDDGIFAGHPDLAPNLNFSLSKSFVPGDPSPFTGPSFPSHASLVAGVAAATDDGFGVVGVAPEAELVGVRVLTWLPGSPDPVPYGKFSWLAAGIVYAANIDADVINISLGGWLDKDGFCSDGDCYTKKEAGELKKLLDRATRYAYKQGSLVVAAAGNDGVDTDHGGKLYFLPAESDKVVAVSATGPVGWIVDPATDLDLFAAYSNFGKKMVGFAAPGGNPAYAAQNPTCIYPVLGFPVPCYFFDLVMGPTTSPFLPWTWASGTSAAAPHVSGVAALIIGQNGGEMDPKDVEKALKEGADDLGKKGKDPYFGEGRVNAAASLEWLASKAKQKDVSEVNIATTDCVEAGDACPSVGTYRVFLGLVGKR